MNSYWGKLLEKQKGGIYRITHSKKSLELLSKYIVKKSNIRGTYENSIECLEERLETLKQSS